MLHSISDSGSGEGGGLVWCVAGGRWRESEQTKLVSRIGVKRREGIGGFVAGGGGLDCVPAPAAAVL